VELDPSQSADWLFVRQTESIRRKLRDCGLPVVGLSAATAPAEARFSGIGQSNDVVVTVSIVYGNADGPWASVDTERFTGTSNLPNPLRDVIGQHIRRHGDRLSAVDWTEGDATVMVDGRPIAGQSVRAGHRWWAVRCRRGDLVISVAGRDWHPAVVAVDTLPDVASLLDRWRPPPRPVARPPEPGLPAELHGEPHRLLVDAALTAAGNRAQWLADGGPMPDLPRYWGAMWRAAVARQADLAEQTEPEAEDAVRGVVDQLSNLHHSAAWFRDDAGLRERAIRETLLYATRLTDHVPSRAAQEAWRAGARRRWLHEWAIWASS
jgi:hypothetical protein